MRPGYPNAPQTFIHGSSYFSLEDITITTNSVLFKTQFNGKLWEPSSQDLVSLMLALPLGYHIGELQLTGYDLPNVGF